MKRSCTSLSLIFLDNAIKYSPSEASVRITLENRNGEARARFADQGVGISSEHLPFICERFHRAAPAGTGEAQSGGLGLAIAQAIVPAQRASSSVRASRVLAPHCRFSNVSA
jgi:signal transduction histidine kinase